MYLLLSAALFALAVLIPLVPAIREIRKPRDDGRLHISEAYVRDPRFFGRSFRAKLAPFVEEAHKDANYSANVALRTDEATRWSPDLRIADGERVRGIAVGDRVVVGAGAGIRDAYGLDTLNCEADVTTRTLTSGGDMRIGEKVNVLRWVDAEGAIVVGDDTNLGVSASGGHSVTLGDRVKFQRVWGKPVISKTTATQRFALENISGLKHVAQENVLARRPVVIYGPLRISAGTILESHVKVHGDLQIEAGVRIAGSVIARGNITFASDVIVDGHVFSENDIYLGPGTRVGAAGGVKTVYAAGRAYLADDVEINGWLVAEDGGETV